jgi:hypothetical protein
MFWVLGGERGFAATAEDHANCGIGRYTPGFPSLEEAATRDDVEAVLALDRAMARYAATDAKRFD